MAQKEMIVEVAYALPHEQLIICIKVCEGMNAEQTIKASGILTKFPEINLNINKIGIFGKLSTLNTVLNDQDRVEIYRVLLADPKETRKQRAAGKLKHRNQA